MKAVAASSPKPSVDDFLQADFLQKVRRLHIRTNRLVNDAVAGNYQAAFRGKGMEFQEVRAYSPGDDVRSIDWNVTARLGEPFVKIYREERELTVILVADMSASGLCGSTGKLKRDLITEIAAVLAFSAIKNNDKVGLLLFSDRIETLVPPKKGRGHVWRVIRELLAHSQQQAAPHGTDIGGALRHINRLFRRRCVIFLLSDFIDQHDLREPLLATSQRHDLTAIHISDPLEHEIAPVGLVEVMDPESGAHRLIDTQDARLRQTLKLAHSTHIQKLRHLLEGAGGYFAQLRPTDDYLHELVRLFLQRERRR